MQWTKPAPELVEKFEAAMSAYPLAERRKMFGMPAAFLNGNMFAGLHEQRFVVRLSPDDLKMALETGGAAPFEPMPGRPMREYAVVPYSAVADPSELDRWLGLAFAYATSLKPKEKKPRAGRSGRAAR
jgi:TfoX/Sxy family transcriptional regulator of competence genes